jgi:hypothetical protein
VLFFFFSFPSFNLCNLEKNNAFFIIHILTFMQIFGEKEKEKKIRRESSIMKQGKKSFN